MLTDSARNRDCTFCYESYFGEQTLMTESVKWEQSGTCERADTLARYPTASTASARLLLLLECW